MRQRRTDVNHMKPNAAAPSCPAGDLLIVMAQIIGAVQMVLEEKFVYKHDVHPLRAVGTEGTAQLPRDVATYRTSSMTV